MPSTRDYTIADPVNSPVDLNDGTLCRARSPQVGIVGSLPSTVASWDLETKLIEAARRTTPKLPGEMRAEFAALLTGTNLAIFAGVLVAWAGSHFFGVGEIVDVILLVVGAFTIGWQIGQVARDLWAFVDIARSARSCDDLDRAADHLARVVVTIGITVFTALIMKAASRLRLRQRIEVRGRAFREASGTPQAKPRASTQAQEKVATPPQSNTRTLTAKEANARHIEAGRRPPYAENTEVNERTLTTDERFVRVHGESNRAGNWLMNEKDIHGLSPEQIQEKFALPETPKYVSDVNVPAGTTVRTGTVGEQTGWGGGGGTQSELMGRIPGESFTNTRPLTR